MTEPPVSSATPQASTIWWKMACLFTAVGLFWRIGRYLFDFPIWGDEIMVALNLPGKSYAELLGHLEHCQVAPPLWLWAEKFLYETAGPSGLSLRFIPLVAGCLALVLHAWFAWTLMPGRAAAMAIALLAVAIWPVSMSTLTKPYSADLLAALMMLLPAHAALTQSRPAWAIGLLAIVSPVALLSSFPAMFMAGSTLMVLLPVVWKGTAPIRWAYLALVATTAIGALLSIQIGHNQLTSPTGTAGIDTQQGMVDYWSHGFPPADPARWIPWFLGALTGQIMAYPVGAANGGSTLTVLLAIVGVFTWMRGGSKAVLALLLLPFALNFMAALVQRYPFGTSCRLAQFLAPSVCLLAGLGIDACLSRKARWPAVLVTASFLALGLGGLARDYTWPYRDPVFVWMRGTMDDATQAAANDIVVVNHRQESMECVFVWRWLHASARVSWNGALPKDLPLGEKVWVFTQEGCPMAGGPSVLETLKAQDPRWRETRFMNFQYPPPNPKKQPPIHVEMVLLERN